MQPRAQQRQSRSPRGSPRTPRHAHRFADALTSEAQTVLKEISPTPAEAEARQTVVRNLLAVCLEYFPDSRIEVYGSSASMYCLRGADIDASLFVDEAQAEDMVFSEDEELQVEYTRADRTKPGAGRHAQKQWELKQERRKREFEARKKKREEEAAESAAGAAAEGGDKEEPAAEKGEDGAEAPASKEDDTPPAGPTDEERPANIGAQNIIVRLGRALHHEGMTDVLPLPRARVPVLKFKDPKLDVACDVCINNFLATENTRLLCAYGSIDPRMVQLSLIVKRWAKRRGINSAFKGTLSSYAYVILVIFFLQTRNPPVLPALQQIRSPKDVKGPVDIKGHDCYYSKDMEFVKGLGFGPGHSRNSESIGQLLVGFFRFYAHDFNFRDHVACIREGRVLTKAEKEWTTKQNTRRDRFWWCIEDPFELSHNLGRVADRDSLYTMRGEFMRAQQVLGDGRGIAALLEAHTEKPAAPQGGKGARQGRPPHSLGKAR